MRWLERSLILAACAALTTIVMLVPPLPARAGMTYEDFKGKFIDSALAKATESGAVVTDPQSRAFAGTGYIIGSRDWDSIPSTEIETYLRTILDKLLAQWTGPKPKITVRLTANTGFDAEATPTGVILLARGVLDQITSEDEVAAILGHECAHLLLNHFARAEALERRNQMIAGAAAAGVTAAYISSMHVSVSERGGVQTSVDTGVGRKTAQILLIKFAIDQISQAFSSSWQREQEDEADLLGVDLMARAGYNVGAMNKVIQLRGSYERDAQAQVKVLSAEYEERLKNDLSRADLEAAKGTITAMVIDAGLNALDALIKEINSSHPDPAKREKNVTQYLAREYEDAPLPAFLTAPYTTFTGGSKVKPILENHKAAAEGAKAIHARQPATAQPLVKRAMTAPTSTAPYALRVSGELNSVQGQTATAQSQFESAVKSDYAALTTFEMLAGIYAGRGQFDRAHATLDSAVSRFGSAEAVYPVRIQFYMQAGRQADAKATYDLCAKVKNKDLVRQCRAQMGEKKCDAGLVVCGIAEGGTDVIDGVGRLFGP